VTFASEEAQAGLDVGQALVDERDDPVTPDCTAGGLGHGLTIASRADGSLI
jgi:hypothetical protein